MTYKLSICIPTHNRAQYLCDTLEKILLQNRDDLQVVISDNASNDLTESVVNEYLGKGLEIKYFRWPENMGADLNYLKVSQLADGEYIWFMGSDDWICGNAINKVIDLIGSKGADIYLCSEYLCDLSMNPYNIHYLLGEGQPDQMFYFPQRDHFISYFDLAQSHSALFGYLSSIIVSRKRWNSVEYDSNYTGTLYSHMFILYKILFSGASLYYISEPLVMWRSGNDSFGGKGRITERYLVDINGFKMIIDDFFKSDDEITASFVRAFRRHHPYKNIAYLRMHTPSKEKWVDICNKLTLIYGYDRRILGVLTNPFAPSLIKIIFVFYRIKLKLSRLWYRIAAN